MDFDTVISGGTIVDGSGQPAYRGDVGIRDGKIAAVGKVRGAARDTIDAAGMMVAPGFVDVHTHYDAQLFWDRMLTISPWHGVTSVVMGNCGFTVAPTRREHREIIMQTLEKVEGMSIEVLREGLGEDWGFETFPEYLDAIERKGTAINVAALVGHTAVRLNVMGAEASERAASQVEIAAMRKIVAEALAAGAVGFSTSASKTHVGFKGKPVPSRLAEFSEVLELAGAMTEAKRGIFQATIGPGLFLDEFAEIFRTVGRPVTWTALLSGFMGPGAHREQLEKSQALRGEGLEIVPQVACRPINFDFTFKEPFLFEAMSMFNPVSAADLEGKKRIYADPEFRERFRSRLGPGSRSALVGWTDRAVISHYPPQPELEERALADVARERNLDALDLALDFALETELEARFRVPVVNYDEDEVEELLRAPGTVVALSDAGAHASQLCDACYATHLLGHWVREKGIFSVEEAVHKLTVLPAQLFGISDRGALREGLAADVVVFDAQRVGACELRRVHDLPANADRLVADATGIELVMVNGTPLRRGNRDLLDPEGALPGRLLRHGAANGA
ncbi:MAG: D-aminoacylase [SAR324 cluster bacterium]|nr:D-aminoacylase [SAR324 cluster bacterium]